MNKTEWRNFLKNHRVDEAQKVVQQDYLLKALWQILKKHQPTCVGLYAAIEGEVDLTSIFKLCQKQEIQIAYPRITNNRMDFYEVLSSNTLIKGYQGIYEPPESALLINPDFLVVPGLAFTLRGKRLGRGKGHYDKYLGANNLRTASLAFSWQLFDDLPTEPHDIKISEVIAPVLEVKI